MRQLGWRALYEVLGARVRRPEWTFMNYGYAPLDPDEEAPVLEPADEPDRMCIQLYDHVVGAVELRGTDVLEVGCGRGGGSSYLARYRGPATVTGVDLSRSAIALCRRHRHAPGLSFVRGDALDLPFPDESFDVVVNVESSHCYPSVEAFLREVHRVLRPGGSLLLADLRGQEEMSELRGTLREGPLEVVEMRDITANVCAALELDDDRRRALLDAWIPRPFHRPFERFAAVEGSSTHARFKAGENRYASARLVRATTARA
ncbi:Methyltransferase domain-containing protein [Georgenia satyanarayanai]|uniref:Methyltransferase domain-containing protein n=2 Tax=Georgenia satyanarayanai TaxID=860221 RepID=A0A2Y9A6P3_9MICO|nr:methyltransferase family protein [Georgenia satyanarayanai]SSA40020.1 Methyltransferase domain-containing protein [Georgenia satyanarayanai]